MLRGGLNRVRSHEDIQTIPPSQNAAGPRRASRSATVASTRFFATPNRGGAVRSVLEDQHHSVHCRLRGNRRGGLPENQFFVNSQGFLCSRTLSYLFTSSAPTENSS